MVVYFCCRGAKACLFHFIIFHSFTYILFSFKHSLICQVLSIYLFIPIHIYLSTYLSILIYLLPKVNQGAVGVPKYVYLMFMCTVICFSHSTQMILVMNCLFICLQIDVFFINDVFIRLFIPWNYLVVHLICQLLYSCYIFNITLLKIVEVSITIF